MNRLEPKNREEAFYHQFEDDIKVLKASCQHSPEVFQTSLETLKSHIMAYESPKEIKRLKKFKENRILKLEEFKLMNSALFQELELQKELDELYSK